MPRTAIYSPPIATLTSQHPALRAAMADGGIKVAEFPFSIGRPPAEDEQVATDFLDLTIEDERPYHIARLQCTLTLDAAGIWLIDASSVHGTGVNGQLIGPGTPRDRMKLPVGSHEIRLGGLNSPYRLTLRVDGPGHDALAA